MYGVRHGVPGYVFPRLTVESNALLFLSTSVSGDWLRSRACERVRLLRLPREACFDEFRCPSVKYRVKSLPGGRTRRRPPVRIDVLKDAMLPILCGRQLW